MMRTTFQVTFLSALALLAAIPLQAQNAVNAPLPVAPPTAAAAGMAQQHAQLLKALDSNHNGRLDPAEIEAARMGFVNPGALQGGANNPAAANMANFQRFMLSKFDANGNGMLDLPEVEAARLALSMAGMNQAAQANALNQLNQLGGNQPADKQAAEPGAPIKEVKRKNPLLVNYDKNGDGKLDAEERKAMEAAKAKGKKTAKGAKRPAKPAKAPAAKRAVKPAVQAAKND
jgi:hypothetical protein